MIKRLFELFIGFRYLKSKKSQGFISFNTFLSVFMVFIGVFILVVVISVMNGFQSQIKDKIIDVDSHISISKEFESNPSGFIYDDKLTEKIKSVNGIKSALPYFQGNGLVKIAGEIKPVILRGFGDIGNMPEQFKKFIKSENNKFEKSGEIFLGAEMANLHNIESGDVIELIVPRGKIGTDSMEPGIGRFKVKGFFKTGYYEYDTSLLFISLTDAQNLFGARGRVSGISIKTDDIYKINNYAQKLRDIIDFRYSVMTAEEKNGNLFYALKLEKLIMTVILFLVIVSAGFTIMGTLAMVVMEKRRTVGILKSLGATPQSIMTIFVMEGFLIGLAGSISGVICGLAFSLNLEAIISFAEKVINNIGAFIYPLISEGQFIGISLVPQNVYYIEGIPTQISPEFVAFIGSFAVFLSTLSAVFPAWHASRLNPVETIRYE
ncbi:MAG TPA: ABC transporter permease [Spirochaetota bacterium]|nr:ABC transporter permease [Spirochaetota bacterium]